MSDHKKISTWAKEVLIGLGIAVGLSIVFVVSAVLFFAVQDNEFIALAAALGVTAVAGVIGLIGYVLAYSWFHRASKAVK